MKIVYLGSGQFGIECLNALEQSTHDIQLIVTQPPHPAGRARKPTPTPVAHWAKANSISFIETDNTNTPEIIEKIASYKPELIIVAAFGQKISNQLIELPPRGTINIHASLLPKYRGAAPINRAIINGESQTGISIITVIEQMDAGDILTQAKTNIEDNETAGQLHDRLAQIAAPLLLKTIDKIADGSVVYTRQNHAEATQAPKLKKSDGFVDFNDSAKSLARKIRGLWPWPGASAIYVSKKTDKQQRVTIAMAKVVETSNPGRLQAGTLDENLNVICGEDALEISKIKPDGSRLMDFEDFVNGRATQPGDAFIKINS